MNEGSSRGRGTLVGSEITQHSAPARSDRDHYPRVAGPVHTIVAVIILGVWAFLGLVLIRWLQTTANPHRIRVYLLSMSVDWIMFAYVVAGARRRERSLRIMLGDNWALRRHLLRDCGIAAGFWLVSAMLLVAIAFLLRVDVQGVGLRTLFPQGGAELALWIALSVTAGVCEETIFRGYLQRQFMALTNSAPAGILLSAAVFGAVHAYQGYERVILIGVYGAMFGILAHWRRSVRPGMIAHAWQDSLTGVAAAMLRH